MSDPESVRVSVHFEAGLAWADMKAKLVLNRLSGRARILATDPPADALEGIEKLAQFTAWLIPECDQETLRSLADVEGVTRIVIEAASPPETPSPPRTTARIGDRLPDLGKPEPVVVPSRNPTGVRA